MGVFIPMAGMLPGVESARRRRCHHGGLTDSQNLIGYRRTTSYLHTRNHDSHICTSSLQGDKLDGPAREAKQRLDERLRFRRKSESKSLNVKGKETDLRSGNLGLQTEIYESKKGSSKRFNWRKLGKKTLEQDECAVCLECFKNGETLVNLPCAHRFHSACLLPWLESNTHCPCCRTEMRTQS